MNSNWREISLWVARLKPLVEGRFVERVLVPERPRFPQGYLKAEWALKLTSRHEEGYFCFSLRPRHAYLGFTPGRAALKPAAHATQPVFGMALNKYLKGAKLERLEALPQERIVIAWFAGETRLGLVLVLIPASPQGFLIEENRTILAQTRVPRDGGEAPTQFEPPPPRLVRQDLPVRAGLFDSSESFNPALQKELDAEAFELRLHAVQRTIKEELKECGLRFRQSDTAAKEAAREPDWQRYGDLLKSTMGSKPEPVGGRWQVRDFETGETAELPADPQLGLREQVGKFYQNARRKLRRAEEAQSRGRRFHERESILESYLRGLPSPGDWNSLEELERDLGISASPASPRPPDKKRAGGWSGKSFASQEGLFIWVGKSRDENLELTFKHARGNDLWMHIRGKPGAHVVIPLHSGRTPSLETLLDAANLAIFYSGGEKWGKTEVDYTFKKHVKRIKDSTEASYTHNKTLMVAVDPERLRRLRAV